MGGDGTLLLACTVILFGFRDMFVSTDEVNGTVHIILQSFHNGSKGIVTVDSLDLESCCIIESQHLINMRLIGSCLQVWDVLASTVHKILADAGHEMKTTNCKYIKADLDLLVPLD